MSPPATSPMRRPTPVEPVKLTMSTCGGGDERLRGGAMPVPATTFTTPGGKPPR